jgi:hypothetical protein
MVKGIDLEILTDLHGLSLPKYEKVVCSMSCVCLSIPVYCNSYQFMEQLLPQRP